MMEIIQERAGSAKKKLAVLDLFSGIGGFSLGLERTGGFETVAFCEIHEPARRVLAAHWPKVPRYADVKLLSADPGAADIVCGGFPCQPYSTASAGKRKGAEDDRALWPEMRRLISESKPTWVIGENVAGFVNMDFNRVVSDLEALGFEVFAPIVPAASVGADHRRDRIWIIGYSDENRQSRLALDDEAPRLRYRGSQPRRVGASYGLSEGMGLFGNTVHPGVVTQFGHAILQAEAAA